MRWKNEIRKRVHRNHQYEDYEVPSDDFNYVDQGDRYVLPRPGQRCEFVMCECWIAGRHIPKGHHIYGYRYRKNAVYLPYYRAKMYAGLVLKWRYVKDGNGQRFPLYWNGSGRSVFEAFEGGDGE